MKLVLRGVGDSEFSDLIEDDYLNIYVDYYKKIKD